jgi:hypothetical protein
MRGAGRCTPAHEHPMPGHDWSSAGHDTCLVICAHSQAARARHVRVTAGLHHTRLPQTCWHRPAQGRTALAHAHAARSGRRLPRIGRAGPLPLCDGPATAMAWRPSTRRVAAGSRQEPPHDARAAVFSPREHRLADPTVSHASRRLALRVSTTRRCLAALPLRPRSVCAPSRMRNTRAHLSRSRTSA